MPRAKRLHRSPRMISQVVGYEPILVWLPTMALEALVRTCHQYADRSEAETDVRTILHPPALASYILQSALADTDVLVERILTAGGRAS